MSVCGYRHLLVLVRKLFLQSSDHRLLLLPARFFPFILFFIRIRLLYNKDICTAEKDPLTFQLNKKTLEVWILHLKKS